MAAARPHRTPRRFCVLSARVLLGTLALLPLSHAWIRAEKECPPGCTDRGNFNKEFGVCDCPPGWGGSICEEPLLGACRTKLSPSNMVMLLGSHWPKDQVQQPFHDLLPYPAFSIRISHDDIPQLRDILRRIPAHTKAVMRRNMARYHHHFRWSAGGLAYNMTIHSLARRLHNLWALMY